MNALSFLGYAIALALAPVAPFIIARWARAAWHAGKALRVLLRERRTGETLYDCAEAIAGDAHNWRGLVDVSDTPALTLDGEANVIPASWIRASDAGEGKLETAWEVDVDGRLIPGTVRVGDSLEIEVASNLIAPQPPPENRSGPALWPLIVSELGDSETDRLVAIDMQQRHEFGVAKYGAPLVASNGRDHLADAYQELLDGVAYLRAAIESQLDRRFDETNTSELNRCHQLYVDMLDMAKEIREMIRERDGR